MDRETLDRLLQDATDEGSALFGLIDTFAAVLSRRLVEAWRAVPQDSKMYRMRLINHGSRKIDTIRAIREVTGLPLKPAKDLCERAPTVLFAEVTRSRSQEVASIFADCGSDARLAVEPLGLDPAAAGGAP